MAPFGYLTLTLAFLLALYGVLMVIWGLTQRSKASIESARLALLLIFPLTTVSLVALITLLLDNRFDVAYVYSVTSLDMPNYLKFTAVWGGQSGSLLFWSWLLAGFSLVFALRKWRYEEDLLAWSLLVVFLVLGFFLSVSVLMEIPFERFWHMPDGSRMMAIFQPAGAWPLMPQDGQGLNPLLRHPGMIWHPPALYLGFVGFIVPFALAVASLATRRKDRRWLEISRPWALIAWVFLTLGLVLGMRWAYDVLGWGGYWGWDPVEIAALMPWLSATAFLHTGLLQRRKDGFKRWNLALVILTFTLVIFGTFITRSGVISSVHSFAGSEIGSPMFIFTSVITLGSTGLLVFRWQDFNSSHHPEFTFSREVLTLFTNVVLLSILAVCLLGVIYPIFSELLTGTQITVGPAWYKRIIGPLLILLLLLLGVCPLAGWSITGISRLGKQLRWIIPTSLLVPVLAWWIGSMRSAYVLLAFWLAGLAVLMIIGEFYAGLRRSVQENEGSLIYAIASSLRRQRVKYGGVLVHLGIVLMSLGIIGIEGLQQETQVTLARGESVNLGRYQFQYEGLDHSIDSERLEISEAVLTVMRNENPVGALYPQRQIYRTMGMAITQPANKSTLARDFYAILVDWDSASGDTATFRIFINPLINWLWIGTGVLTMGAILAVWPGRKKSLYDR